MGGNVVAWAYCWGENVMGRGSASGEVNSVLLSMGLGQDSSSCAHKIGWTVIRLLQRLRGGRKEMREKCSPSLIRIYQTARRQLVVTQVGDSGWASYCNMILVPSTSSLFSFQGFLWSSSSACFLA